jgi:uncharacterized phage protein (predicted DNA packaging)
MVAFFFVFERSVNLRRENAGIIEENISDMKWLTIPYIKKHSRIDYDCEDDLLELYGEAAEETVMNITGRDYDDIVANFGTEERPIPAAIIQASLILVDTSYMQRTAVSPQQMFAVPYAFDMLIKPYMRLAQKQEPENE